MRFVFIDDDADNARQWLQWAENRGHKAYHAESALEANRISADFYVFDISAISGIMRLEHTYSPICALAENHPGAVIVVVSAVSVGDRESVIEDVLERSPDTIIVDGGWGTYDDFEKAIGGYLC